jgi:hypothetical protein
MTPHAIGTSIELVLSYQHEPENAQAVPGRGTARNTRKPLVDTLSAVKTARGAARISMVEIEDLETAVSGDEEVLSCDVRDG